MPKFKSNTNTVKKRNRMRMRALLKAEFEMQNSEFAKSQRGFFKRKLDYISFGYGFLAGLKWGIRLVKEGKSFLE